MAWSRSFRVRFARFLASIILLYAGGPAQADFVFGEPAALEATINSGGNPWFDCISADGLELYLEKPIAGGSSSVDWDLFVSIRAARTDPWPVPVNLGPSVNSPLEDSFACLSSDGLQLYFASNRSGSHGDFDLWVTTRPSRSGPWGQPENLGPTVNTTALEMTPWITSDALELYFSSNRPDGYGRDDLWVARRPSPQADWGRPTNLGAVVNSGGPDAHPCLSRSGLTLLSSDYAWQSGPYRPGGLGHADMWMSRRKSFEGAWQSPVNLGHVLNSHNWEVQPRLSFDGFALHFSSNRPGGPAFGYNIWQAAVIPIVDFNGDGRVDSVEIRTMAERLDTSDFLCDIGPTPCGDGTVDVEDLRVLAEYIGKPFSDPSLMAHWALDESAGQIAHGSSTGRMGILLGEPAWAPEAGMVDGALEFDGVDDCILAGFVLDPGDGPFSVLVWIKGGAPGQVLLSQVEGADWLMIDASQGTLATELAPLARMPQPPLVSDATIADGSWHRVVFVWDRVTESLYVDGLLVAQDQPRSLAPCRGGLILGCNADLDAQSFFTGLIDDVRFYSRAVEP